MGSAPSLFIYVLSGVHLQQSVPKKDLIHLLWTPRSLTKMHFLILEFGEKIRVLYHTAAVIYTEYVSWWGFHPHNSGITFNSVSLCLTPNICAMFDKVNSG